MSPRWLRQDDRDPIPWELHQDQRLENLLPAFASVLPERVQESMTRAAGCGPAELAALQWIDRVRGLRACDVSEVLGLTTSGGSRVLVSLFDAGCIERARHPHDQRQWRLRLTERGWKRVRAALNARAGLVRELVRRLPFPWRLRLIRILERLLAGMIDGPEAVYRVCRHCDWTGCREDAIEPCPVSVAFAHWSASSGRTGSP